MDPIRLIQESASPKIAQLSAQHIRDIHRMKACTENHIFLSSFEGKNVSQYLIQLQRKTQSLMPTYFQVVAEYLERIEEMAGEGFRLNKQPELQNDKHEESSVQSKRVDPRQLIRRLQRQKLQRKQVLEKARQRELQQNLQKQLKAKKQSQAEKQQRQEKIKQRHQSKQQRRAKEKEQRLAEKDRFESLVVELNERKRRQQEKYWKIENEMIKEEMDNAQRLIKKRHELMSRPWQQIKQHQNDFDKRLQKRPKNRPKKQIEEQSEEQDEEKKERLKRLQQFMSELRQRRKRLKIVSKKLATSQSVSFQNRSTDPATARQMGKQYLQQSKQIAQNHKRQLMLQIELKNRIVAYESEKQKEQLVEESYDTAQQRKRKRSDKRTVLPRLKAASSYEDPYLKSLNLTNLTRHLDQHASYKQKQARYEPNKFRNLQIYREFEEDVLQSVHAKLALLGAHTQTYQ